MSESFVRKLRFKDGGGIEVNAAGPHQGKPGVLSLTIHGGRWAIELMEVLEAETLVEALGEAMTFARGVTPSRISAKLHELADHATWSHVLHEQADRASFDSFDGKAVHQPIGDALDWACFSCRDDVGWLESEYMERSTITGDITVWTTCGHCGAQNVFDLDGNEVTR